MQNNSEILDTSKTAKGIGQDPLVINVRGCSNTPSFKNRKRAILDSRTGKLRTLTERSVAKRKKAIEDAIVSELLSAFPTSEGGILTVAQLQSLTASLPQDDDWQSIPILEVTSEHCKPGEEGFTLTIERLT